jgi:hypothetical protein
MTMQSKDALAALREDVVLGSCKSADSRIDEEELKDRSKNDG